MGESAEAAAYVWSRAPKIEDAFNRGVLIRSARGVYLTIPTAAAARAGGVLLAHAKRSRRKAGRGEPA
ncbi:MAG: DUF6441 family protein [Beijerinckiaceae bacterium]|nr:DUF6441 family protein [Beijerinckiaceae bacterium]